MGILGDSKSTTTYPWGASLITALQESETRIYENTSNGLRDWAHGSYKVSDTKNSIDAWILTHPIIDDYDNYFLINLGVNDMLSMPDSATWCDNYIYIVDALKTKYSNAKIYLTYPWMKNYTSESNIMAGWIDSIIAERSSFVFVGDDERTWLENGDDGVTMTTDGVHYSEAGNIAKVAAVCAVLGF
jgi:lysophospholipase L1-like esterase